MRDQIVENLKQLELDQSLRVLFACESGSRAWGFASPDSDYDVRFLYVRPIEWYLSIEDQRDVVEAMLPGDIDLAGWDLRKTLGLLRKSNPALLEWLRSPIIYSEFEGFIEEFRQLAAEYYSLPRCFQHYLHMAQGNWRAYLQGEQVAHKKYLYVLRPVLAARWIERRKEAAPMEFEALRSMLNDRVVDAQISELLKIKAISSEVASGPPLAAIQEFLAAELARLEEIEWPKEPAVPTEPLNRFFRRWIDKLGA